MITGLISIIIFGYLLVAIYAVMRAGWQYRWGTLANVLVAGTLYFAALSSPNCWWISLAFLPLLFECAAVTGERIANTHLLFSLNVPQFMISANIARTFRWDRRRHSWAIRMQAAQHLFDDNDRQTAAVLIDRGFNEKLPPSESLQNQIVALSAERLTLNYDAIIKRCHQLQALDPNNKSAYVFYFIAAIAYLNQGKYGAALDEIKRIRQFVPKPFLNNYTLNFIAEFDSPNLDRALSRAKTATYYAEYFKGVRARAEGNMQEARLHFEQALNDLPQTEPVHACWRMRLEQAISKLDDRTTLPVIDRTLYLQTFEAKVADLGNVRHIMNRQMVHYELLVAPEKCATLLPRLAATSVDFAIVSILPLVAGLMYLINHSWTSSPVYWVLLGVTPVIALFYGPIFEASSWNATPGKRLLGLKAVTMAGDPLTFNSGFAKQVITLFLSAVIWVLIIPLMALSCLFLRGPHKQTLQDRTFNRLVVVDHQTPSITHPRAIVGISWVFMLFTWVLVCASIFR